MERSEFVLICTTKKAAKIPIMKNGNNLSLKSLKLGKEDYTIANTCAFDSIFQILLAAGHDMNHILSRMEQVAERDLFFKLIVNATKTGINHNSYKLRAQILLDIFPSSIVGNCKFINCVTNVGYLGNILFKNIPSFKETSQCNSGCPPRLKNLSVIQIEDSRIANNENFNEAVRGSILLEGERPCCSRYCHGSEKTTLSETGK